jgi:MFS family permease
MLCFGRTEAVLIVARVFQGISAAVVWTVGLALIVDTVGEARVGQAMAYASSAMSMGLILGPVLGGVLYDKRGYYAAFALAFALIVFDLVLRVILVEKKIAVRYENIGPSSDEENSQSIKLHPVQPLPQPEANEVAQRVPSPVLSVRKSRIPPVIRILRYPRLLVALFLSFVQATILSAFDATLPLYLNALFGFTALESGIFSAL